ncbi:hypothetical protein [Kitasatospora paranensis]|uniref:Uncharacterized protein n=1 Tax=Kitasatospora paranensis TaxID=258053 RepID=A0ABW2FS33_9ACTN
MNFARYGEPDSPGAPGWRRYAGTGSALLDLASTPSTVADPDAARFAFLASFRADGRFPDAWASVAG